MNPPLGVHLAANLLDLLFPSFCLGCAARLRAELRPPPLLLCPRCRGQLRRQRSHERCPTCTRTLSPADAPTPCAGCRKAPPPIDRLLAAWSYRPPLDRVLQALKFARLEFLAEHLAELAVESECLGAAGPWDLAVPVPLAPWRRLARGFNQAERLAAALAAPLRLPCSEALARRGLSPTPQTQLGGRERRRLRQGGMLVRRPDRIQGKRILLVDDVTTTGATLVAAAGALRHAGAASVTAFAFALTPLSDPLRLS
jgi:ComF family protein